MVPQIDKAPIWRDGTAPVLQSSQRRRIPHASPNRTWRRSTRRSRVFPPDQVRLHVCWGNSDSPHTYDIPMAAILPELYRAKVGALSIEFSNPRHQHEYDALRANPLPKDMLLIPCVLDTTTNFVEHPELVARRLAEAVSVVGDRERVIAGTDCGFGTFTGREYGARGCPGETSLRPPRKVRASRRSGCGADPRVDRRQRRHAQNLGTPQFVQRAEGPLAHRRTRPPVRTHSSPGAISAARTNFEFRALNPRTGLCSGPAGWRSRGVGVARDPPLPCRALRPAGFLARGSRDPIAPGPLDGLVAHRIAARVPDGRVLGLLPHRRERRRDWPAIRASIHAMSEYFQLLEGLLAVNPFLLGDKLSLADIPIGTSLYRYFELDIERPELPCVTAQYERLRATTRLP